MSPIAIFLIAFAIIFGGTLLGMYLRTLLSEHHLSADSRDVMKMGTDMLATMAAIVLGLLITSAKGTFDTMNSELKQTALKIVMLDSTMARYGPETREARDILRRSLIASIERVWPEEKNTIPAKKVGKAESGTENLEEKLRQLAPRNDNQRRLQSQALQIRAEINDTRWLLSQQLGQRSFPMPLLVLLVSWLAIIFSSFGLLTSRNTTVIAVLFICALAASSSLFLILELDHPLGGLIKISSAPLLNALAHIGQ
jgi:hypothetical protein